MRFNGVVVYPRRTSHLEVITVGLWTSLVLSEQEKLAMSGVFQHRVSRTNVFAIIEKLVGTSVQAVLRVSTPQEARLTAAFLAQLFKKVTGSTAILRELPTPKVVRRALAS